jgi:hypothetical protein
MFWEALFFHKFREFSDGISFFELIVNLDLYDSLEIEPKALSHNPKLIFSLKILNHTIFDFSVYSVSLVKEHEAKFKWQVPK